MSLKIFRPVVGHEELHYDAELLELGVLSGEERLAFEVVDGGVRLLATTNDHLAAAWDLDAPFGEWPCAVSKLEPPTERSSVVDAIEATSAIEAETWPAGRVVAWGPGARARWIGVDDAAGAKGATFLGSLRDGFDLVIDRVEGSDGFPVGAIPLSTRHVRGRVGRDGALWRATAERRDPSCVDLHHAEARARSLGSIPLPMLRFALELDTLLERKDGVWVCFAGRDGMVVRPADQGGFGAEWTTGISVMGLDAPRFAAWREGFVVAVTQSLSPFDQNGDRRLVTLASDGVRTTRAMGVPPGEAPLSKAIAVAVDPNGATSLIAYFTPSGLVVTRARFAANRKPADPWAIDREVLVFPTPPAARAPVKRRSRYEEQADEGSGAERRVGASDVIRAVRLDHMLECLGAVHFGMPFSHFAYRGDASKGTFESSNGEGSNFALVWDASGVLGLEHALELQTDTGPRAFLKGLLPSSLSRLLTRASKLSGFDDYGVSGAFWVTASGTFGTEGEIEYLAPYISGSIDETVDRRLASFELSQELCDQFAQLAIHLASVATPYQLTEEEGKLALTAREHNELFDPANAQIAVEAFASAGIAWPTGVAEAARLREATLAARTTTQGRASAALLLAAHHGDLAGVLRSLEEGAHIDAVTFEGQIQSVPTRASALLLAIRAQHREIALALIERGADVNLATGPAWGSPETPLRLAACSGDLPLCEALLARGADVQPSIKMYGILWFVGHRNRRPENVDEKRLAAAAQLLLDAGAPMPEKRHRDELIELAKSAGAAELLQRLEAEP